VKNAGNKGTFVENAGAAVDRRISVAPMMDDVGRGRVCSMNQGFELRGIYTAAGFVYAVPSRRCSTEPHIRSMSSAMPCPTPMHIVQSA
jgi:hypothetical protein